MISAAKCLLSCRESKNMFLVGVFLLSLVLEISNFF